MITIKATKYSHRFLARIVIEANTPLAVGSGGKDIITDALVTTDVNGLPYIPGTSIAGVFRSMIGEDMARAIFGYQEIDGHGSDVIFSEAKILNSKGTVIDGLDIDVIESDELLKEYKELPIRQHVRINGRGVTDNAGKFDEQIVFAGTRFCFELEMLSDGENYQSFEQIISQLNKKIFRLGSGTRSGFGEIKVIELKTRILNLKEKKDLELYLTKSSRLSSTWDGWENEVVNKGETKTTWVEYKLTLQPEDFFLFGSGFGDEDADITPVKARKVEWKSGTGILSDNIVLIPATSVKGALSHRVAFHWNKLNSYFAGNSQATTGKDNEAVRLLFGSEGKMVNGKMVNQLRGNLIFSDIIEAKPVTDKILNHVSIDRFTGGAMDGALFSEKTTYGKGHTFEMIILADKTILESNETVKVALESSLKDICKGLLPLGGGVNRGNGVFKGSLTCNGEVIF